MQDAFTVSASALPSSTRVAGFRGTEGLSRPYAFEIYLVMTNDVGQDVDLARVVGTKATLRISPADGGAPLLVNGVFATLELVHAFGERSVFRAVLVPQLWKLSVSLHSRVFTDQTVPDILKAVLAGAGVSDYELRLVGSYKPQEHVCQYRESDLDFISRWMEREGLYYYFEQGDGGETLIITDDRGVHAPLGDRAVRYVPQLGEHRGTGELLWTFTCRHTSMPSAVRMNDYDYNNPAVEISGKAPVATNGVGEIIVHGARFFTPADGSRLARVKAEALLAGQVVYHGTGTAFHMRPGYTFELEEHPRPAFNAAYLTTEVEHWGNQTGWAPELTQLLGLTWDDVYRMEVKAISTDVQYRAPQRTPWPRIYGTEHAVVDGPADSEYAQIDEHGRYAVKLSFDESDLRGGKASTWVRMLQPHGGGVEGFHFPLRKGTEVLCSFLGGDPDRPVIVGVAPNALKPSPITSANNTKNIIQTGGRNLIELEDQAGAQRVVVSTPTESTRLSMGAPVDGHNLVLSTDGTGLIKTGQSLDIDVGTWRYDQVGDDMTVDIGGIKKETVEGAVIETYKDLKNETVTGVVTEVYKDAKNETVTGAVTERYLASQDTKVTGLRKSEHGTEETTVNGTVTEVYKGHYKTTVTAGGRYEEISGGLHDQKFNSGWKVHTTGNVDHTATGDYLIKANHFKASYNGDWHVKISGIRLQTTWGGLVNVTAGLGTLNIVTPQRTEVILGAKVDIVTPVKYELTAGINSKQTGAEFKQTVVKGWNAGVRLGNAGVTVSKDAIAKVTSTGAQVWHSFIHMFH
ncbi:type VI secretion system tip protein TssI/VgrG [Sorangium sp. So ce1036]|uniref:type VI secretion system Vgr family protein n=1 Tax=Sorangium sp. So ce1036 TaxID=3133328 RepID=UPI003F0AE108